MIKSQELLALIRDKHHNERINLHLEGVKKDNKFSVRFCDSLRLLSPYSMNQAIMMYSRHLVQSSWNGSPMGNCRFCFTLLFKLGSTECLPSLFLLLVIKLILPALPKHRRHPLQSSPYIVVWQLSMLLP